MTLITHDVAVPSGTLHTHEVGPRDAQPILWLHGSGPGVTAQSNWGPLIDSIPGYRHLAPDLLGFGDSTHPEDLPLGVAASANARADAVLELLDALDVERTHLVGNSMGGMISLLLLEKAPHRFGRVVLMGSGGAPITPGPDLLAMIMYYNDPSAASMTDLMHRFMVDTGRFGAALGQIAADRAEVAARADIRRSHLRTFSPDGAPLVFTEERLACIEHEILVVHGREDRIIPRQASYYLAEHLPNAQLHVLPHAGHWVQIEQEARFRALAVHHVEENP